MNLRLRMRSPTARFLRGRGPATRSQWIRLSTRYRGFVRLRASSYFLAGGEGEDLIQEGLIGLYKAVRDYRPDREASFRSFAELCVTRQIITGDQDRRPQQAHPAEHLRVVQPLRARGASSDQEMSLAEILPDDPAWDPINQAISSEELRSLIGALARRSPISRAAC